jgi:hypothetical protein
MQHITRAKHEDKTPTATPHKVETVLEQISTFQASMASAIKTLARIKDDMIHKTSDGGTVDPPTIPNNIMPLNLPQGPTPRVLSPIVSDGRSNDEGDKASTASEENDKTAGSSEPSPGTSDTNNSNHGIFGSGSEDDEGPSSRARQRQARVAIRIEKRRQRRLSDMRNQRPERPDRRQGQTQTDKIYHRVADNDSWTKARVTGEEDHPSVMAFVRSQDGRGWTGVREQEGEVSASTRRLAVALAKEEAAGTSAWKPYHPAHHLAGRHAQPLKRQTSGPVLRMDYTTRNRHSKHGQAFGGQQKGDGRMEGADHKDRRFGTLTSPPRR